MQQLPQSRDKPDSKLQKCLCIAPVRLFHFNSGEKGCSFGKWICCVTDCFSCLQSIDPIIGGFDLWIANWEREGIVDFSANPDFPGHSWKDAGIDCLTLPRFTMSMSILHF